MTLFSLAFVAMITPGPNNLVVLSLSIAGDLGRTVRACGGIVSGSMCLVALSWFGAVSAFEFYPVLRILIVGAGSVYLMWCGATLVLSARCDSADTGHSLPSSFWGLAGFQFANPKAWVLSVAAVSAMQNSNATLSGLIVLTAIFGFASLISLSIWASLGRLLPLPRDRGKAPSWVNIILGLALISTSALLANSAISWEGTQ